MVIAAWMYLHAAKLLLAHYTEECQGSKIKLLNLGAIKYLTAIGSYLVKSYYTFGMT